MQPLRRTASRRPAEADLVERARAGSRDAFEQLCVRVMPMLAGTARRLLGDPFAAEEAVAEALFRAFRHMPAFRADAEFGTWVHRILCRVAIDRFRSRTRERSRREGLIARARDGRAAGPRARRGALERLAEDEETRRIRAAVENLPTRQRLVLVLHVWEGLALRETAEALGIRYATAKSNLCHARKALRALLDDDEETTR